MSRWSRSSRAGVGIIATAVLVTSACSRDAAPAPLANPSVGTRGLDTPDAVHLTPPEGVVLFAGKLRATLPDALDVPRAEVDVLGVYYSAMNHPYLVIETDDNHRMTLYEAPSTGRMMLDVDPAFLETIGLPGIDFDHKFGSYVPLADLSVRIEPSAGLREPPLDALSLSRLPVALMSGPGSSRGDRPEDALVHLSLELAATRKAGSDPRAPGLLKLAATH